MNQHIERQKMTFLGTCPRLEYRKSRYKINPADEEKFFIKSFCEAACKSNNYIVIKFTLRFYLSSQV